MNKKIFKFNADWNNYKQNSFATIFRSIADVFYDNIKQYTEIFKEIFYFHSPNKPQLTSKKSIILIPSNDERVRQSLKKIVSGMDLSETNYERKSEKSEKSSPNRNKSMNRKSTLFYQNYENYCQFEIHLRQTFNLNLEDEHLKYLNETELIQTFKTVEGEMNRMFEEYKNKLVDQLKYIKEIKEVYLNDIFEANEFYANSLNSFSGKNYRKFLEKKNSTKNVLYQDIFEIILGKIREYNVNIMNYREVLL